MTACRADRFVLRNQGDIRSVDRLPVIRDSSSHRICRRQALAASNDRKRTATSAREGEVAQTTFLGSSSMRETRSPERCFARPDLEIADHAAVRLVAQAGVRQPVNILADEPHTSVTEHELCPAGVLRFETERSVPVRSCCETGIDTESGIFRTGREIDRCRRGIPERFGQAQPQSGENRDCNRMRISPIRIVLRRSVGHIPHPVRQRREGSAAKWPGNRLLPVIRADIAAAERILAVVSGACSIWRSAVEPQTRWKRPGERSEVAADVRPMMRANARGVTRLRHICWRQSIHADIAGAHRRPEVYARRVSSR